MESAQEHHRRNHRCMLAQPDGCYCWGHVGHFGTGYDNLQPTASKWCERDAQKLVITPPDAITLVGRSYGASTSTHPRTYLESYNA